MTNTTKLNLVHAPFEVADDDVIFTVTTAEVAFLLRMVDAFGILEDSPYADSIYIESFRSCARALLRLERDGSLVRYTDTETGDVWYQDNKQDPHGDKFLRNITEIFAEDTENIASWEAEIDAAGVTAAGQQ